MVKLKLNLKLRHDVLTPSIIQTPVVGLDGFAKIEASLNKEIEFYNSVLSEGREDTEADIVSEFILMLASDITNKQLADHLIDYAGLLANLFA